MTDSPPRDSAKDAETIELLINRFHELAHKYAMSTDEDEGGYLSTEHIYQSPSGSLFQVRKVVPLWPRSLRSQVIFESEEDGKTFVLPLSEWFFQGFRAVLDEFSVHSFRDEIAEQLSLEEDLHRVIILERRRLGINDANENHVPLAVVPALIDRVASLVGGYRETVVKIAAGCLRSKR